MLYHIVMCCTLLFCLVFYSTIFHCIVLDCIVLHCNVSQNNSGLINISISTEKLQFSGENSNTYSKAIQTSTCVPLRPSAGTSLLSTVII